MADNPLKHSDLIINDGAIDELINKLEKLNTTYSDTLKTVKDQAIKVEANIEKVNSSTENQRESIKRAAVEANKLSKAQENLEFAMSDTAKEIATLKAEQQKQNQITKLQIKLTNSAEGSYDKLSAQYSLNKIELNKMSSEQRKNTEAGKSLEKSTKAIFGEMKNLQEATGKNTLNVGNYAESIGQLLTPSLAGAINGVKAFGAQLWALVANPVGAVIAAIVLGLAALYKGFTQTSVGAELLEQGMAALKAIFDTVLGQLGRFITGQITFKELISDTSKEIRENVKASIALVKARRDLEVQTVNSELAEAKLAKEIAKLSAVRDSDAKSLSSRRKAAEALTKVQVEQSKERVEQALREQRVSELALKAETEGTETYREAQIALTQALAKTTNAETELIATRAESANQLELIRLDIFEQELDLLLDITDRQKTINEQRIANEGLTVRKQRELADENVKIIEDAFQKQIAAFEELNNVQIDQEKLLNSSGAEILVYADSLGFAERAVNRLREVVIEKTQADQDNLQTLRDIDAKEKKLAEDRIKRARQMNDRLVSETKALRLSEIDLLETTEAEKTKLRLDAERKRLKAILNLNKFFGKELSELQVQQIKNQIALLDKEIAVAEAKAGQRDIYDVLGFKLDDEGKQAISDSVNTALSSISQILNARVQAAQRQVEITQAALENERASLDAQLALAAEGREADIEGAIERFNEQKALNQKAIEEQRKAQRAQQQIDSIIQTTSLITASSNIFKALSPLGPIGVALAIGTIGTMFGAFLSAKIQAARASRRFGKGGDFDIVGGSHASGNDVSLGIHNGVEMRAEGGEKAAIFSRKSVSKYGSKGLSDIIHSINKGDFQNKYSNAFSQSGSLITVIGQAKGADTKELLQENARLREELKETVKSLPQNVQNWDDGGYRRHIRKGNTTYLNTREENSYGG